MVDRLTLRAVLRQLASGRGRLPGPFRDDQQVEGGIGRVGRDFCELHSVGEGGDRLVQAVPNAAVAALQGRQG